jgi:hypothetical protein
MADRTETTEPPVDTGASLQGQGSLLETPRDHSSMEGIEERASFDVAEALEADLGNLHPEDEALIESVVAAGETTQATQDSQQATAAAAPTEATTATAPAAAAAPKKTRKRGFSYARKKLVATKEVYLKPGCIYHGDQSLVGTITACPRKGKTTYTIAWNGPLPVGLNFEFLQTEFPKDTGPGIKGTNCARLVKLMNNNNRHDNNKLYVLRYGARYGALRHVLRLRPPTTSFFAADAMVATTFDVSTKMWNRSKK